MARSRDLIGVVLLVGAIMLGVAPKPGAVLAEFTVILGGLMGEGGRELIRSLGFDLPEIERRSRANLRRVFAEARSEGVVDAADPDLLVAFYLAFFDGLLITHGDLWPALPPDALRDAVLRLVGYQPAG